MSSVATIPVPSSVAPEPPAGWSKPSGYIALRCQFCLCWSTMASPFTHGKAHRCKFYPLIAWYQGTRDYPKGWICMICANASCLHMSFLPSCHTTYTTHTHTRTPSVLWHLLFRFMQEEGGRSVWARCESVLLTSRRTLPLFMSNLFAVCTPANMSMFSVLCVVVSVRPTKMAEATCDSN